MTRHGKFFENPFRPVFHRLSDEGLDNYDRIFGVKPLPNEKDALESYIRKAGGEKIPIGSHAVREEESKP